MVAEWLAVAQEVQQDIQEPDTGTVERAAIDRKVENWHLCLLELCEATSALDFCAEETSLFMHPDALVEIVRHDIHPNSAVAVRAVLVAVSLHGHSSDLSLPAKASDSEGKKPWSFCKAVDSLGISMEDCS